LSTECFQYHKDMSKEFKTYKVFKEKVEKPFEEMRVLSNGDKIGALITEEFPKEEGITLKELLEYIKENHVEPKENENN
jgi:CMP-2-keto-3-deoxyoctulosonic acid synthetase